MTAKTAAQAGMVAGAASHDVLDWHAIDWRRVHQTVRRLQARIVKAIQEGRWGKVRALQHLLTHSFSAKKLAVPRVTASSGDEGFPPCGIVLCRPCICWPSTPWQKRSQTQIPTGFGRTVLQP